LDFSNAGPPTKSTFIIKTMGGIFAGSVIMNGFGKLLAIGRIKKQGHD